MTTWALEAPVVDSESRGLMAPDSSGPNPFCLFWITPDQGAANPRVQQLRETIENKLGEDLGVTSFWDNTCESRCESEPRVAHNQRQLLRRLPPLARCGCLERMQASLNAMETPPHTSEVIRTFAETCRGVFSSRNGVNWR